MKDFFKKLWTKIKNWAIETAWPWLKKGWMHLVNIIIVAIAYGKLYDTLPAVAALVGFWLFILLAYYIFWKFFGFNKVWKNFIEEKRKKNKI